MSLSPNNFLTEVDPITRMVKLTRNCAITNKPHSIILTSYQYKRWCGNNDLIQKVLPELSVDDREFLISGVSPEGFELMFPKEEE